MTNKFIITLKNEKVKLYNRLSWLIIFINIVVFIYFAFFAPENNIKNTALASLILLTACFLLRYYFRNSKYSFTLRPFFMLLMIGWFGIGNYWIAGIIVLFDILSAISIMPKTVRFSYDYFDYPSFPPKTIYWDKVTNVLLKDGLLTFDLKNNKLIQQMIDESKTVMDEKEFNDFCKERMKAAATGN